jgi:hypothetical protein
LRCRFTPPHLLRARTARHAIGIMLTMPAIQKTSVL